jgi:hypothetical protein
LPTEGIEKHLENQKSTLLGMSVRVFMRRLTEWERPALNVAEPSHSQHQGTYGKKGTKEKAS